MKQIPFTKVYTTAKELNESPEYKKLWEGFEMKRVFDDSRIKFVRASITESGNIYVLNRLGGEKDAGMQVLNKQSICGCLHDGPFYCGYISDAINAIMVDTEHGYDRCMKNRVLFAKDHERVRQQAGMDAFVTIDEF